MVSNCADLTLSIFLYLTVRSPIWHYNYRLVKRVLRIWGSAAPTLCGLKCRCWMGQNTNTMGNSLDKLRHPRFDAYLAEQVLLNKQQIWCGGAYPAVTWLELSLTGLSKNRRDRVEHHSRSWWWLIKFYGGLRLMKSAAAYGGLRRRLGVINATAVSRDETMFVPTEASVIWR